MTVIQTQSRFSALTADVHYGWLTFLELMAERRRARVARREARLAAEAAAVEGDVSSAGAPHAPDERAEDELRAAYRLWFGGDPLGRL